MAAKSRQSSAPGAAKPRSDAYVGLLTVSLLAQLAGAAFLYMDYSQYEGTKDPIAIARDLKTKAGTTAAPAPPGAPPPGAAVGAPPPGAMDGKKVP